MGVADAPLHFVFEARGAHYTMTVDGAPAFDFTDTTHGGGEAPIAFGGVGFSGSWEQMFTVDDVVVADLTR